MIGAVAHWGYGYGGEMLMMKVGDGGVDGNLTS